MVKDFKKFLLIGSGLFLAIVAFVFFYFQSYLNQTLNIIVSESEKTLIVKNGDSFNGVVYKLAKDGIIKHPKVFIVGAKIITRNNLDIKIGEYLLASNKRIKCLLDDLTTGKVHYRKMTFAEGLSTHTILKSIEENQYLKGEMPHGIGEGELLPETYMYTYGDTKADMVNRMKNAMADTLDALWITRDKNIDRIIKNKKDVIALASIVEKETGVGGERELVASVFYNRLRIGMRLQSDPTVVYAFAKGDVDLEREIRVSDLRNKNEYNTYTFYGLPKGPVSNPGIESIKAVLNPPKTKYLYFVATGNGGHNFSTNLKQHNEFVSKYRKVLRENGK